MSDQASSDEKDEESEKASKIARRDMTSLLDNAHESYHLPCPSRGRTDIFSAIGDLIIIDSTDDTILPSPPHNHVSKDIFTSIGDLIFVDNKSTTDDILASTTHGGVTSRKTVGQTDRIQSLFQISNPRPKLPTDDTFSCNSAFHLDCCQEDVEDGVVHVLPSFFQCPATQVAASAMSSGFEVSAHRTADVPCEKGSQSAKVETVVPVSATKSVFTTTLEAPSDEESIYGCRSNATAKRVRRHHVNFDTVQIRFYEQILCDNPGITDGPSLGINWEHFQEQKYDLKQYEMERGLTKRCSQLVMPRRKRIKIARRVGYSESAIAENERTVTELRLQRKWTAHTMRLAQLMDYAVESAKQHFSNLLSID